MSRRKTHEERARSKLAMARAYASSAAEGSPFARDTLLLAHCEACAAVSDAEAAEAPALREQAENLSIQVGRRLSALGPIPNPGMKRHKNLRAACRDADRRALRSRKRHYVYRLAKNPHFAVLPSDHPIQYNVEKGLIGVGSGQIAHVSDPPAPTPNPGKGIGADMTVQTAVSIVHSTPVTKRQRLPILYVSDGPRTWMIYDTVRPADLGRYMEVFGTIVPRIAAMIYASGANWRAAYGAVSHWPGLRLSDLDRGFQTYEGALDAYIALAEAVHRSP